MQHFDTVSYKNVEISGGFWKSCQQRNRETTISAVYDRFKDTGRFDAFRMNWRKGMPNQPHIFWDSDIAKWVEGVAYALKKGPMPEQEAIVEGVIDLIEAGQCADGYFNIYYTNIAPSERFLHREQHELYCAGHLLEAAVAYDEATGRDRFLKIMMRYVDLIDRVFRVEKSAAFITPGHEELELALVKLYRHTGEERYLELAKWFVDRRGENGGEGETDCLPLYNQSHAPVREMDTAEGHCVRLGYLFTGVADVARETGDEELLAACKRVFENIVKKRMYVTGGLGSSVYGEAFTVDYDLPNEVAYTETCAAISLAYFAQRMLTMEADSAYADVVETVLYNGFLAGLSLDGKRFFYSNPLAISLRDKTRNNSMENKKGEWRPATQRVEVFNCSCCPPNVVRVMASLGDYLYTTGENRLYVHQFMNSTAEIDLAGRKVQVAQETDYPVTDSVKLVVENADGLEMAVRVPGWCPEFELDAPYRMENGYAVVTCEGERFEVTLRMKMEAELVESNPEVQANVGRVALRRGPVVYCLEAVDNGEPLQDLRVDACLNAELEESEEFRLPVIYVDGWCRSEHEGNWLYRPLSNDLQRARLLFIPYYAFANRGESDMQVWTLLKR